jgi:hypothetical protein
MTRALQTTRERLYWWLVFALGVCLSLVMAMRSQIGGDQRMMLELGWRLAVDGQWLPYGMPTSAGGYSPGGFMALLVAIPLYVWRDYRSPALCTALLHAVAFLLLVYSLKPTLTRRGIWLLLLLVWLNPWRMYFSAHIWNSNLMFVAAVLHLVSAQRMAQHREAWNTAAQVLLIALAMQLHTSAAVLGILSLLLLWKGIIKVSWVGFAVGVALSIAVYVPWLIAIHHDPSLAPGDKGFFLRGLIYVFPLLRGILYWLKMPTLSVASRMLDFDFTTAFGASVNALLTPLATAIGLLAQLSLIPSLWANWRFIRRRWPRLRYRAPLPMPRRAWLKNYIALMLVASLFSFAISPTTVMFWQVFIALPCCALILTMAIEVALLTKLKPKIIGTLTAWCMTAALLLMLEALAAPLYRCGGIDFAGYDEKTLDLNVPTTCGQ